MMKKVSIALVIAALLVAATLGIAPRFLDGDRYRPLLVEALQRQIGYRLSMPNGLRLSLLPVPALSARDIVVTAPNMGKETPLLTIAEARARISPWALLFGRIEVKSVALRQPTLSLERNAEGHVSWAFAPASQSTARYEGTIAEGPLPGAAIGSDHPIDLQLSEISVKDGQITLRDAISGLDTRIDDLETSLRAAEWTASVSQAFRGSGSAKLGTFPVEIKVAVSSSRSTGTSFSFEASHRLSDTLMRVSGVASSDPSVPSFLGRILVKSASADLPVPMAGEARLRLAEGKADFDDLSLEIGSLSAKGRAETTFLPSGPKIDVRLDIPSANLDDLVTDEAAEKWPLEWWKALFANKGLRLPRGFAATLEINAEALLLAGHAFQWATLDLDFSDGVLSVRRLATRFPGNAHIDASGSLSFQSETPTGRFSIEAQGADLRTALTAWDINVSAIPPSRLARFRIKAAGEGNADKISLSVLNGTVDSTEINGTASLRLESRPQADIALTLGALSLDSYWPRQEGATPLSPPLETTLLKGFKQGFPHLADFDAHLMLRAQSLTWRDIPVVSPAFDLDLKDGTLTLLKAGWADAAGTSLALSGKMQALASKQASPRVDEGWLNLKIEDLARVSRVLAEKGLDRFGTIRSVNATIRAQGTAQSLSVAGSIETDPVTLNVKGTLTDLGEGRDWASSLDYVAQGESAAALMDAIFGGPFLAPRSVEASSPFEVKGHLQRIATKGTAQTSIILDPFFIRLGLSEGTGAFTLVPKSEILSVTGHLDAEHLSLPVPEPSADSSLSPGSGRSGQRFLASPPPPLSLQGGEGDVALTAKRVTLGSLEAEEAVAVVRLSKGTLSVENFRAKIADGTVEGTATVTPAEDTPDQNALRWTAKGKVADASLAELFPPKGGKTSVEGRVSLDAALSGSGWSEDEIRRSVSGQGSFAATKLAPTRGSSSLGPIGAPLAALDRLGAFGKAAGGLADISGRFEADRGLFTFDPVSLESPLYSGTFAGVANLTLETLSIRGKTTLSPTLLALAAANKYGLPREIPIEIDGQIQAPTVRIKSGLKLDQGGIPWPQSIPQTNDSPEAPVSPTNAPEETAPEGARDDESFRSLETVIDGFRR